MNRHNLLTAAFASLTITTTLTTLLFLAGTPALAQDGMVMGNSVDPAMLEKPPRPIPQLKDQACPAWVHDKYVAKAPNGKLYRIWHPQRDAQTGCLFEHEHGRDPKQCRANRTMPLFGYIADMQAMPMVEPHEGFKVECANKGEVNNENRVSLIDARVVFHQGTGNAGRFAERFHSLQFDVIDSKGNEMHIQRMADTGGAISVCDAPVTPVKRGVGPKGICNNLDSYEIWGIKVADAKYETIVSVAAFDPITLLDGSKTIDSYPELGETHGCRREVYYGPMNWTNAAGPAISYTDSTGVPLARATGLKQTVTMKDMQEFQASRRRSDNEVQNQFKVLADHCAPGLGSNN